MSAQHTPGPKVHLQRVTGGRSACRYSARPSRNVKALPLQQFATTPVEMRCAECETKYRAFCAAIAKATGGASEDNQSSQSTN